MLTSLCALRERRWTSWNYFRVFWLYRYVTTVIEQELTTLDRCDACGAQAYVRVRLTSGELYFCGHHATKYESKLFPMALDICDERRRINEEPLEAAVAGQ